MADALPSFVRALLGTLDVSLFERVDNDRFVCRSSDPDWMHALGLGDTGPNETLRLEEHFLFLHSFLEEAAAVWRDTASDGDPVPSLRSDRWVEQGDDGSTWFLEAVALTYAERDFLILRPASVPMSEHRHVLQEGRSLNLRFQQLQHLLHRYEITLECLLHDLKEPVANLQDAMPLLSADDVRQTERSALIHLMRAQVKQINEALQDTLAETHLPSNGESNHAPARLSTALHKAINVLQPRLEGRDCTLRITEHTSADLAVVADSHRLRHVLQSLLSYALYRSPKGSTIEVNLRPVDHAARIEIADAGPAIPSHVVPHLFDRFPPGAAAFSGEYAPLALYFCRVSAESWGGDVGYSTTDPDSVLWLRLPMANTS